MTKAKENILRNLARIDTDSAQSSLEKEIENICLTLKETNNYTKILRSLELLEVCCFRSPEQSSQALISLFAKLNKTGVHYDTDLEKKYCTNLHIKTIEVLHILRFTNTSEILKLYLEAFGSEDPDLQKRIDEFLVDLASYDLYAMKSLGYAPQLQIIHAIKERETDFVSRHMPRLEKVFRELLSPSGKSSLSDYNTVTFQNATLPINDDLKQIRHLTIQLIFHVYDNQVNVEDNLLVIRVLKDATQLPCQTDYSDDWINLVKENYADIVSFFLDRFEKFSYHEIQAVEDQIYWFTKRGNKFEGDYPTLNSLSELIQKDDEYQIFKILAGDEFTFRSFWDEGDFSLEKNKEFRFKKIEQYISDINKDNWGEWKTRIIDIASTEQKSGRSPFWYIPHFLQHLALKDAGYVLELLNERNPHLKRYNSDMLSALKDTDFSIRKISQKWVSEGYDLHSILRIIGGFDEKWALLKEIKERAVKDKDLNLLSDCLTVVMRNYPDDQAKATDLFLGICSSLIKEGVNWTDAVWFLDETNELLLSLNEKEIIPLLQGLIEEKRLDYHSESLLGKIASKYPELVVNLFEARISNRQNYGLEYDAIPYEMPKVYEGLLGSKEDIFSLIYNWFGKGGYYDWETPRLLAKLYSQDFAALTSMAMPIISGGTIEDAINILRILQEFDGDKRILPICEEILKVHGNIEDLKSNLYMALDSTGVVCGEFGMRDAHIEKRWFYEEMRKSNNSSVKEFSEEYIIGLEKQIEFEHNRSYKQLETRKKLYGVKEERDDAL